MTDDDLIQRIAASTGLPASVAARVVDDVLAWHDETVEAFVRRRHASEGYCPISASMRSSPTRRSGIA